MQTSTQVMKLSVHLSWLSQVSSLCKHNSVVLKWLRYSIISSAQLSKNMINWKCTSIYSHGLHSGPISDVYSSQTEHLAPTVGSKHMRPHRTWGNWRLHYVTWQEAVKNIGFQDFHKKSMLARMHTDMKIPNTKCILKLMYVFPKFKFSLKLIIALQWKCFITFQTAAK